MPGNLMRYSGLITKTRAMKGKLLTKQELAQLTELATVNEVIDYLKGTSGYGGVYQGHEGLWHRGQAEAVIVRSLYQDFEKLYSFADASQRLAFEYAFFRYEVDTLKIYLKKVFGEEGEMELPIDAFFNKHASFSIEDIKKTTTIQEFAQCLVGTPYGSLMERIAHAGTSQYVDYAVSLDVYYYSRVFKSIKRMKQGVLKEILRNIYGCQIDWQNIMWIYRSKRFYSQTSAELYAMLIPYSFHLSKDEIGSMVEAVDVAQLEKVLAQTWYFSGKDALLHMEDGISYTGAIDAVYQRITRKYQVSIAPILEYIYQKEQEIQRLTTIIEGIRYQIPPKDIKDLIGITI